VRLSLVGGGAGGGATALWLAVLDQRIRAAVVSGYFCSFRDSILSTAHCECNYIPGILNLSEMGGLAASAAPRPLCVVRGREDPLFPVSGTVRGFETVRQAYDRSGAPDGCRLAVHPGGHRYQNEVGRSWFARWLQFRIRPQTAGDPRSLLPGIGRERGEGGGKSCGMMFFQGRAIMKIVTFGEIMLRLSPPGFRRFRQAASFEVVYGGGEANVALTLADFGEMVEFVTRLPQNDLGEACLAALRARGLLTDHVARGGDRLGIYFLEHGAAQRGSQVIYDRAGSAFAAIQPGMIDWPAVFAGADWFHWTGITPAVSQGAAETCQEAVTTAKRLGLTVSCDLNYRSKLWKWGKQAGEVMPELVSQCDLAVGNEEDAEKVFGIRAPESDVTAGKVDRKKYRSVCEGLAERFPNLKTVAVTLRGSLSASHNTWSGVLLTANGFHLAPVYDILPVVDRVGAGDAFNGGLIHGLRTWPDDPQTALRFAAAASCLKHSIPGDVNAVTAGEVNKLMEGDASGRVAR
jgi:2-dehydro-3-deoxygluconokinase